MEDKNNAGKKRGGITGKGFTPGKSGNPHGRPKKQRVLKQRIPEADRKRLKLRPEATWADVLALAKGAVAKPTDPTGTKHNTE